MSAPQNDPAQTPPTSRWYTEEMLETFLRSWNGMHVGTAPDRIRAGLDAIAPMVEERLTEAHHDGYTTGWYEAKLDS